MTLRDHIQQTARRILRLPKKPAPPPPREPDNEAGFHPPLDPLLEPAPPKPRRPARSAPNDDDL